MATYHDPPFAGIYYVSPDTYSPYYPNHPATRWLPQVSLSSVTRLHSIASRTSLSQTFVNPSNISPIANAKYTFPLYESCAIVSLRCYVGTRFIEGIIKEKEAASATYNEAIERLEPATLLEQQTSDVFSVSLGNIPPGETVRADIEYIMELRHDAEVDGLRFTIPTGIAPRYGASPSGYDASPGVAVKGMNISVEITMSSNIQSVQSPSHPISICLGRHSEDTPDNVCNPQHALATLGQTSTELGKDFVLLVKCASLSSPSALLETHASIPNSKALMLTLVPKFTLPEGPKPEVIFIADRSGSMSPSIAPLKSSLSVFLKSLPLDIKFNICSFGSSHSFLWPSSQPYSNATYAEAQRYCNGMQANFGGTEILAAVKSTVAKRCGDLNLEIMVLTDGEVWNSQELFEYVEKETAKGDVRLFSLGIGQQVSHALIDGLARAGRGFSQVVADATEAMESKVARMLRGALSAHVLDYRVEWEGKPTEEEENARVRRASSSTTGAPRRMISLFDDVADADSPVSFSKPANFVVPSVLQAPYKLPPLFPFSRCTAYAILPADAPPPSYVWLRGTTPAGDELELEIEVQHVPGEGETVHQLAARKILQELKEGAGYLHGGKYGLNKASHPILFEEGVKREGVRVGLKYGVASQWTSFVAVVRKEPVADAECLTEFGDDEEYEFIDRDCEGGAGSSTSTAFGGPAAAGLPLPSQHTNSVPVMMMRPPPPPSIPYPMKRSYKMFPHSLKGKSSPDKTDVKYSSPHDKLSYMNSSTPQALPSPAPPPSLSTPTDTSQGKTLDDPWVFLSSLSRDRGKHVKSDDNKSKVLFPADIKPSSRLTPSKPYSSKWASKGSQPGTPGTPDITIAYSPSNAPPAVRLASETGTQPLSLRTRALIDLQTFEGSFRLDQALAALLGVPATALEARLRDFVPVDAGVSEERRRSLWATVLAVRLFETQLGAERGVWELVVDKARGWMRQSTGVGDVDIQRLEKMAAEVLSV